MSDKRMKDKQTRYMPSMGLAFNEEKEMAKLGILASEGWLLKELKTLGYSLRRDKPADLVYAVDYADVSAKDEDYLGIFSSAGWEHVCSQGYIHIFRPPKGTAPIYSDPTTLREKYLHMLRVNLVWTLVFGVVTLISIVLSDLLFSGFWGFVTVCGLASTVPGVMVVVAAFLRYNKIKGKGCHS